MAATKQERRRIAPVSVPTSPEFSRLVALLVMVFSLSCMAPLAASEKPLVAAASGLQFALREIAGSFNDDTGIEIRLTLASSGKLFRQIENKAPFEMFISADPALVKNLVDSGLTRGAGEIIARGRLAVIAPEGSPLRPDAELRGLEQALDRDLISRFAIASPEHAPYGRRAREALQSAGLWERIQRRLVIGENVAQATQFALSGAAEGGLVALSLLVADKTVGSERYALLPEAWHRPLLHSMVLLKQSDQTTMKFFHYLKTPPAQRILRRYGYTSTP